MKYPRPSVSGIVFNHDRKVLLVRDGGRWRLPGRPLEGGSDWLTSLKKSMREETGIEIKRERLVGIYSDPKVNLFEVGGVPEHQLVASFLISEFDRDSAFQAQSRILEWFPVDNLPVPLWPSELVKIQDALNLRGPGEVFTR